jgi:hypothetical protein
MPARHIGIFYIECLFFIAQEIERLNNFKFDKKEMKDTDLVCTLTDDSVKFIIKQTYSQTDFDIVLATKQKDGKYLRERSITVTHLVAIVKRLEPWWDNPKLKDMQDKTGLFSSPE